MKQPPARYRHIVRDSLRKIRTKIGLRRKDNQSRLPTEVAVAPTFSRDVGFVDSVRRGWFNHSKRELFPGFSISPSDTVLDVGCGPGSFLQFCAKYASHSIGIDINPNCVEAAKQTLQQAGVSSFEIIQSDGNRLPVRDNSIDKIVCTEVFEHVDDPQLSMRELVRVGKPGALYMLSVPGELSEKILKEVAPASCFERPNHIRVFSSDEFRHLVESSGLKIESHEFCGFYWAVWHAMIWKCGIDYDTGTHPVLEQWARTWEALMALPEAEQCIGALERALHKSQIIIARKPQ